MTEFFGWLLYAVFVTCGFAFVLLALVLALAIVRGWDA